MEQLTKDQAVAFDERNAWEEMSFEQRAKFQICQELLCMPFSVFHEAVEKTVGRPVFTHEFGLNYEGIKAEIFDGADPPELIDIINMIPKEKLVVIGV